MVMKVSARQISILKIIVTFVALWIINDIAGSYFMRWDLTDDQRYTLKESTIALLEDDEKFQDRMIVRVYLEGEFPAEWKKLQKEVRIKLEEYRAYAGDKFEFEFIDPFAGSDKENEALLQELYQKGLKPMLIPAAGEGDVGGKTIVPGAIIKYPGQEDVPVMFFPANRSIMNFTRDYIRNLVQSSITNMEFNLTSGIKRSITKNKPRVVFLQGHGELEEEDVQYALSYAREYYNIEFTDLLKEGTNEENIRALRTYRALIIAQPKKPFTEKEKFLIDQFIMKGGRVMWMIDPVDPHKDSLQYYGRTLGLSRELNLGDQFFKYGIRVNNDIVVDERVGPIGIPSQDGRMMIFPWYFFPLADNIRNDHPITNNMDRVKLEYASSIDTLSYDPDIRKTVLLQSSERSTNFRPPVRIFYDWVLGEAKPNFEGPNSKPHQIMAVLLEGTFESLYKNRITPEFRDTLEKSDYVFKEESSPNKMIVVADGDLIRNDLDSISRPGSVRPIPIERSYYSIFNQQLQGLRFGNKEFFLNSLDYLLGDESLIASRNKMSMRLLDMNKVKQQKRYWQFINVTLPVAIIVLFAIGQGLFRRYKYTRT